MRTTLALSMVLACACAAPSQALRPTDARTTGHAGEPAAAYEIRDADRRAAQVNIWSQGAYQAEDGTGTYVHIAIEVMNVGNTTVELDTAGLTLEVFDGHGAPLVTPRLAAVEPAGPTARPVAVGRAQTFDSYFTLGRGVLPEQVSSLRLRWVVLGVDDESYVQFTDFTKDLGVGPGRVVAYVPIFGFYDPYWVWVTPRPHPVWWRPHHVPVRRVVVVPHHHR